MKVYSKTVTSKGHKYKYFLVDAGTINGKRITRSFKTIQEANEFIKAFKRQREKYGNIADRLSPMQYNLAVKAFDLLTEAKMDEIELIEAVQSHIKRNTALDGIVTIADAVNEYIGTFSKDQVRHIATAQNKLKPFANEVGKRIKFIAFVKETDIKGYVDHLEAKGYSVRSRNGFVNYAKTFFNWCLKQKYVTSNPVTVLPEKIVYEDPEFISVKNLEAVLRALESDTALPQRHRRVLINFYTLSFFCGIRSSEIHRIEPSAVHPEDSTPYIRISTTKGATKGIKGRVVDMEANVVKWLEKYPMEERLTETLVKRARESAYEGCLKPLKDVLTHNVGRHSYITYHVAKYRDYGRTEAYCGTSSGMRCKHYQGLAPTADGIAYFDLKPLAFS